MRILIDIGHPGHVHLFKNFALEMQKKDHEILFTCRDKEFEIVLLKKYGFKFKCFGKHYKSKIGKIKGLVNFDYQMLKTALRFKPDVFLSHGSMYAAHASFIIRKPHIALEDSENMEQIRLYKPFSEVVLTPDAIPKKYGKKQVRYNGFHQSAYLHPKYFKKNSNYKSKLGLKSSDKVFLLRLVALNASHDFNLTSICNEDLFSLIDYLKERGHVFISSEKEILKELEQYRLVIPPEEIHDFIAICDLVIGESGVMTSEAGYLGIPNVLIVDLDLNVHRRYSDLGLKFHFKDLNDITLEEVKKIVDNIEAIKLSYQNNANIFVKDSIDLTKYMIDFVESNVKNKLENV